MLRLGIAALRVYSDCVFGHCVYLVMYRSYLVMHVSLYHGIHDFSALYHCINSIIALYCCIIALYHWGNAAMRICADCAD